jgi:hypothetical protein
MKQTRHSISVSARTATQKVAVHLAVYALAVVAGADFAFATIDNTATANGFYNGNPVVSDPVTVNVPVSPGVNSLQVTKVAAPDTNVAAGTTVTYTYTVTNSGVSTLTNVTLADTHKGVLNALTPTFASWVTNTGSTITGNTINSFAPGDVATFTATYTITQSDLDNLQ